MRRKWISVLLALMILLSFSGCRVWHLPEGPRPPETSGTGAPTDADTTQAVTEPTQSPERPTAAPDETTLPTAGMTQPPETEPPTQPPATQPPATQPPVTEPPATEPPVTDPPPNPNDIFKDTVTALEQELMDLINAERVKAGLEPLELDPRLCAITSMRAYECSILFEHTRPNGESCFSVMEEYGYMDYKYCGENILYCSVGFFDAADMVGMWMESEGHRENILSEKFNEMGLAVYEANGFYYAANLFTGD